MSCGRGFAAARSAGMAGEGAAGAVVGEHVVEDVGEGGLVVGGELVELGEPHDPRDQPAESERTWLHAGRVRLPGPADGRWLMATVQYREGDWCHAARPPGTTTGCSPAKAPARTGPQP